jgi:ubiquinone/menaquinone biosynthesis C-methylase UbiE
LTLFNLIRFDEGTSPGVSMTESHTRCASRGKNREEKVDMEWQANWEEPLQSYMQRFDGLLGDARTRRTFQASIKGIMAAGTLICQRIAACSADLSQVKDGAQRVLRLATGESTKRSQVDAEHLTAQLREVALAQLAQAPEDELWLIADSSDLRKPYAEAMPSLMQVRDLAGHLVPGYRTLNVLGLTPGRRGILYHRLFSSTEPGFVSESGEVQQALTTVSQAVTPLKKRMQVSWILDQGFDDIAVWRTIWEQQEHVVCRVYHTDRLVEFQDQAGQWQQGDLAQACTQLRPLARAETSLEVRRGKHTHPKKQPVLVDLSACPLRLSYWSNVRRRGGKGKPMTKAVWLVQVVVLGTQWEPWLLLTDWPVENEQQAVRLFALDRQRWAVEMEVVGIDISRRMIEYASTMARVRRLSNLTFRVMDVLRPLDFPDHSFDLVNARLIFGFTPHAAWPALVQEGMRITRPGGIIRLTEGESDMTTSLATQRLTGMVTRALQLAGRSFSPDGRHFGIIPMLGRFLREAGCRSIQRRAYALDWSAGTQAHESTRFDLQFLLKLLEPFLIKMQVISAEEFEPLYQLAFEEMQSEHFCAVTFFLSVWGERP